MKKYFLYCLPFIAAIGMASCESYSKYTIDEKPTIKIDDNMLGIWKVLEDTNHFDYFIVQDASDKINEYNKWVAKNTKEHPTSGTEYLEVYKSYKKKQDYWYYITRMDKNGLNNTYENFGAFISNIRGATFLSIPYRYFPPFYDPSSEAPEVSGYFFVRILNMNEYHNTMTIAVVGDKTMKDLNSSAEVRKRISQNLNSPSFYSDTLHLFKVSKYHENTKDSRNIANHWPERLN
jgi:hypothetical protein